MYEYVLLFICCWFKAWLGMKSVKLHCITFPSRKEIRLHRFAACTTFVWPSPELVCVCRWTHWTPCKAMLNPAFSSLVSSAGLESALAGKSLVWLIWYSGLEKSLSKQGVYLRPIPVFSGIPKSVIILHSKANSLLNCFLRVLVRYLHLRISHALGF